MAQALSDLKVVEYAQGITGPWCGKLLADYGAEVIKVEDPGIGDKTRRMEPFVDDIPHPEKSGLFLYLNTNKLGITLNLKTATGQRLFKDLIREADILVENNGVGAMDKLGLGWKALKKVNPRLIMTTITPFGLTGPWRDYKGGNLVNLHASGPGYMTPGQIEDPENHPPLKTAGHQADFMAGLTAAICSLTAVFTRRLNRDKGEQLDISEHEAVAFQMARDTAMFSWDKTMPKRTKAGLAMTSGLVPCQDGFFYLHLRDARHWDTYVKLMGNPGWAKDERFKDDLSRGKNYAALEPLMMEWTMRHGKEEIYHLMQGERVATMPLFTVPEVVEYRQMKAREFFTDIKHPEAGTIKYPGAPFKMSATPWRVRRPAPTLGQHNREVLCGRLGCQKEDLGKMRSTGVI